MNIYYEFMIAGISGFTIGTAVSMWFSHKKEKENALVHLAALQESRFPLLRDAVWKTSCANALIFKIHNGGGKLTEGVNWYSSVIDEAPERDSVSAKYNWQNIIVDDQYKQMIRDVKEHKTRFITTDSMPTGLLKRNYERMKIVGSIVMEVFSSEYAYYYVSYPVRENHHLITQSEEYNVLEITTILLQKKYRTYNSHGVLELE